MVTVEVNGRTYSIRDFMTLAEFEEIKATDSGYELVQRNLLDANGELYPTVDAMLAAVPCPDYKPIRKKIWNVNGFFLDAEDEPPLPNGSGSSGD